MVNYNGAFAGQKPRPASGELREMHDIGLVPPFPKEIRLQMRSRVTRIASPDYFNFSINTVERESIVIANRNVKVLSLCSIYSYKMYSSLHRSFLTGLR